MGWQMVGLLRRYLYRSCSRMLVQARDLCGAIEKKSWDLRRIQAEESPYVHKIGDTCEVSHPPLSPLPPLSPRHLVRYNPAPSLGSPALPTFSAACWPFSSCSKCGPSFQMATPRNPWLGITTCLLSGSCPGMRGSSFGKSRCRPSWRPWWKALPGVPPP